MVVSEGKKLDQTDIILFFCVSIIFSNFKPQEQALISNHYEICIPDYPSLRDVRIVDEDGWFLIAGERVKQLERRCVTKFEALVQATIKSDILEVLQIKCDQGNRFATLLVRAWNKDGTYISHPNSRP